MNLNSLKKIVSLEDSFFLKKARESFILNWLKSKPGFPLLHLLPGSFTSRVFDYIRILIENSFLYSLLNNLYDGWLSISLRFLILYSSFILAFLILLLTYIAVIPLVLYLFLIIFSLLLFSLFLVYPRLDIQNSWIFRNLEFFWDILKKNIVIIFWSFFPFFDLVFRRFTPLKGVWDELFLIAFLILGLAVGIKNKVKLPSFAFYLMFFYLVIGLSALLSPYPLSVNIEGLRGLAFPTLIFFIAYVFLKASGSSEISFSSIAFCSMFLGIIGIAQYVLGLDMPPGWVDVDYEALIIRTRAFSIIGSPNFLAAYLLFGIGTSFSLLLAKKQFIKRIFWFTVLIINILSLSFTFARGSFLALGASIGLLSILVGPILIILLVSGGLLSYFILPTLTYRILFLFSPEYLEKSLKGGRLYRWLMALDHIKANILFGTGPGTFGGGPAIKHGFFQGISVDSCHLRVLAETGIVGYVAFVGLFLYLFRYGLFVIKTSKFFSKKALSIGALITLLAFFLHSMVENLWDAPGLVVFFALLATILVYVAEEECPTS
ncbi:MAG: hypothetical protein DDT22_00923 [candidate division WS2 bacterium]|nr:hypothetical protein [Candidatus Lithacetigena glycinireducens]